jgi:anti-sigma regulatory factor (Ser/Thr protein kinase)
VSCHRGARTWDSGSVNDGTEDQVKVSFPASPAFSRIGRVAVAGLALRLGVDIADVEKLRMAVDQAVSALHGKGRINLNARWMPHQLLITIDNPDHVLDERTSRAVISTLTAMVDEVRVGPTAIDLRLAGGHRRFN